MANENEFQIVPTWGSILSVTDFIGSPDRSAPLPIRCWKYNSVVEKHEWLNSDIIKAAEQSPLPELPTGATFGIYVWRDRLGVLRWADKPKRAKAKPKEVTFDSLLEQVQTISPQLTDEQRQLLLRALKGDDKNG